MKNKFLLSASLLLLITSSSQAGAWFKKSEAAIKSITENKLKNTLDIESNLAGFKKEDIKIMVSGGILKVNAEKKDLSKRFDESEKKLVYKQKELLEKSFEVDLKKYNVNLDNPKNIKVAYNDGILLVSVPRSRNAQVDFNLKVNTGANA